MNTMNQCLRMRTDGIMRMAALMMLIALWSLVPTLAMAEPLPAGYVLMASGDFFAEQPDKVQPRDETQRMLQHPSQKRL